MYRQSDTLGCVSRSAPGKNLAALSWRQLAVPRRPERRGGYGLGGPGFRWTFRWLLGGCNQKLELLESLGARPIIEYRTNALLSI